MSHLTRAPIELGALIARVSGPESGAIASFLGVVRAHHEGRSVVRLEYSAYEPMAEAEARRILAEAEARWPVRLALVHRLGPLVVGEVAVAVVAASAHRAPAFEACRHVMEEVKRRLPVWKKEFFADGGVEWVGAPADRLTGTESPLVARGATP